MKLGWAAGCVFSRSGSGSKVLIGKDTRISGYLLESALEAGFASAGVDVSLIGPIPTPGIAYLTLTSRACAGVVISASHNPYYDNGIKIFSAEGTKLNDKLVAQIDDLMRQPMKCAESVDIGRAERFTGAHDRYIEYCKSTLPAKLSLAGIRIVVDCANGAAYEVAPRILDELGADLVTIANQPDGFNINQRCGSTHLDKLAASVVEQSASIGIALDGDADRVLLIDETGRKVDGDQILYLIARYRHDMDTLEGGVAGTLMTNLGLELALKNMSIPFVRTRVGDRYVHEALIEKGWLLGGEASGHVICLDKASTGDGIVVALEVLQIMLQTGKPLSELVAGMEIYPQKMINVRVQGCDAKDLVTSKTVAAAVVEAEQEMGDNSRVVLRPSGTEPFIRVMIESNQPEHVERLTQQIADVVAQEVISRT
jgi:phosphoglucosamine mutase